MVLRVQFKRKGTNLMWPLICYIKRVANSGLYLKGKSREQGYEFFAVTAYESIV